MNRSDLGLLWLLLGLATLAGSALLAHRIASRSRTPARGTAAGLAVVIAAVATVAVEGAMLSSIR